MVEAGPRTSGKTDTTHSTLVPHPIAIFIIMDIAAFGVFLVIFMVERLGDPAGFASGAARLHAGLGWINTFVLMTSGALVATAENGFRTQGAWRCWVGAGIAAGSVFGVVKLFDQCIWVELVLLLEHFECLDILSFLRIKLSYHLNLWS